MGMRALVYDGLLRLAENSPPPLTAAGEALVRVTLAGICNTDLEITRGYTDFRGVLGHEFVGVVEQSPDGRLVGQRVVGEINASCGVCSYCKAGLPTRCSQRTVLGIHGRSGAFAEHLTLPLGNLHPVPAGVSDEEAVFVEPLAAAVQILDQVHIRPTDSVIVLGDGKLGLLAAQVLTLTGCDLLAVGKHAHKLALLAERGIRTAVVSELAAQRADVVVECTGQPAGLEMARTLVHPRGTIVLKSTFHGTPAVALTPYVVDEVTIVGSRCGPFAPALRLLQNKHVEVRGLISAVCALADGVGAMESAAKPGVLKVLLRP
jgi:threonine dehydrogenase-like Zn-dependent dehydrogenase